MAIGDIIVGIDIGTSKVSLIIGEVNNFNQIEIICSTNQTCSGIKKGKIVDEAEVVRALDRVLEDAEADTDLKINSAYVTVSGRHVAIIQNCVTKEIKDKYIGITQKDVSSAIMQAKDIDIPEDMSIIDVVADRFLVEDGKEVTDPVGNFSSKFTLKAQVILADKDYIRQIANIFRRVDLEVDGMVPVTLAERNLVLEPNELNDNVMILDIGAGNTDIGVFEGQNFVYTNTIPLGGDNITNDIAYVLNISLEEADKLKKQYGLAMKSYIDNDTEILLTSCKGNQTSRVIKSSELIEIIEARIEEIFTLINKDISLQGVKQKINNVILTGQGVTNISKSDVVAKVALNIPVKMATGRAISTVRPGYRTVYSLIRYISTRQFAKNVSSNIDVQSGKDTIFKNILEKVKDFFYS